MFDLSLPRSAGSARLLVDLGAERGVPAERCLRGTGLRMRDISEPSAEIAATQELAIVHNLVAALPDPHLGLDAGSRYSIQLFGMYGFACMSAPTLREVIEISLRYQDLAFTLAQARLVTQTDASFIEIGVSHLDPEIRPFVVDHCLATVWATMTEIDGSPPAPVIELDRPAPAATEVYAEVFGTSPRFGIPVNRIGFSNAELDRRRPGVDPVALALCERQCLGLIARRKGQVGTRGLVRERLARATVGIPTMETIASDLNMSSRTLRRSLAAEGTSFRELDEEVRRGRAEELLAEGLSVGEVATRVGYATGSAFVHAYKRWHGVTPGRSRQAASPVPSSG